MGTVGLSFGSPTAGTGFNVSQTVAAIISNLQNVETPWQNQLTALESQDTVPSSLGTLFSNLSTDINSLTDFQGVLAEKTGSSSDENVLELTSATPSAAAGTHTVVVNSLAQTSSGYLAPITNASDTLSGAITLQVGASGTPQTITLNSSDNTLSGLAAAINSSGVGVTASVLTDSTGSRLSLVSGTSGGDGDIQISANSIVDASNSNAALAYTSSVTGEDASLTVDGVGLTSASNTVTNLIPGVTFQLLAPSATESDGSLEQVQVVIANDNTDVESTVNQFVSDYNALTSAINAQEGNTSSGTPEPLFGSPTLSLLQQQLASSLITQNPNGSLAAIQNAGDTLAGSLSIQVGSGTAENIVIGAAPATPAANTIYTGSGVDTLAGVASAINSANIGVTANVVSNSGGTQLELVSGTAGTAGALIVSSSITDTTTNTALNYTDGGSDISTLTELGISVNDDGTLTLDATSLDSVLNSDYSGVVGFFQNANSWGITFANALNNAGTSSTTGILSLAESSNSSTESSLNANISRENLIISAQQSSLTQELNNANEILQALPQQLNDANELYSAITGYNENSTA
ncbi:MAG: flagellar filament capping protein FliD [Terracidiphilus sp.]